MAKSSATPQHDASGPQAVGRPVLVTTAHRGVFFGYAEDTSGGTVKLTRARCCIYWPRENKGFMGLAADGPKSGARVGPAADIELRDVTSIVECSPEAVAAWEAQPWK
jgi:hypothetical protein